MNVMQPAQDVTAKTLATNRAIDPNWSDKVNLVTRSLRKLWPQYDQDLDQSISEMAVIMRVLDHTIRDSHIDDSVKSRDDLEQRNEILRLLCYREAGVNYEEVLNDQILRYRVDSEMVLNQQQINNVLRRWIGDPSVEHIATAQKDNYFHQVDDRRRAKNQQQVSYGNISPAKRVAGDNQAKALRDRQQVIPKVEVRANMDYVEFYRRVKAFGADRKWDDVKINKMLGDPKAFEKEWKLYENKHLKRKAPGVEASERGEKFNKLYEDAFERKAKQERAKAEKDALEEEEAIQMSSMPLTKKMMERGGEPVRTHEQFMEDQIKYEQRRYENLKRAIMKEEEAEQFMFQPEINQKSVDILNGLPTDPVELSKMRKLEREAEILRQRNKAQSFTPQINKSSKKIKRGIDDLAEDANRRLTTQRQISEYLRSKHAPVNPTQISSKSDKFVYDRFEQDFMTACQQLDLVPEDMVNEEQPVVFDPQINITCAQMSQLFLTLGFVRPQGRQDDQLALAQLWTLAGGDEHGQETVPLQRVKVIMCAIQNFHIDWLIDDQRDDVERVDPKNIGRRDGDRLYLKSEEITYLTKKYVALYQNRQDKLAQDKKNAKFQASMAQNKYGGQNETFQPKISEKNLRLAEKRLLEKDPVGAQMPIEQRLIREKELRDMELEQQIKAKEDEELMAQPYRPDVSQMSRKIAHAKSITMVPQVQDLEGRYSKWDMLYLEANKKIGKHDLSTDEVALRKEPDEYTFQPNKNMRSHLDASQYISQGSVNRSMSQPGHSRKKSSVKPPVDQGRKRMSSQNPLRYSQDTGYDHTFQISVNIGGSKKQIQANVDADPGDIARRFINEHGIDAKFQDTLEQMIADQINRIKASAAELPAPEYAGDQ